MQISRVTSFSYIVSRY